MEDCLKVHYDPRHRCLELACGADEFARLRDLLIAEARVGQLTQGQLASLRSIELVVEFSPVGSRVREHAVMLGCGLIGAAVAFVMMVGVSTVIGWFR
jgi:hypothetical protein